MFLVKDRRLGMDNYVFTRADPRTEGYKGNVIEGVDLFYDMNAIHLWPDGQPRPEPQLGHDPKHPKRYRVFKSLQDLHAKGFTLDHPSTPFVADSWLEYRKRYYPVPEEYAKSMTQDEWFDFLEEADNATSIRRKMSEPDQPKPGSNRDQIAEWVARRHMAADGGIQQVWFLGMGSPVNEIRLLEVSERFTGDPAKIEPVDFGVDIGGTKYTLLVADISAKRLEKIKGDPTGSLPKDWSIDGALVWDRRGRRQ